MMCSFPNALNASLQLFEFIFAGDENCDYQCTSRGGCTVDYVGPLREGNNQVETQPKDCLPPFIKNNHNWAFFGATDNSTLANNSGFLFP